MFNAIVVGVDGHQGGRDALVLGDCLRRTFGGELIAVHAYPYMPSSRASGPHLETIMRDSALGLLQRQLGQTRVAGNYTALAEGSPAVALHKAAEWHCADVIVVGADHRGAVGRALAGNVTAATVHGAHCAVVVAPPGYAGDTADIRTIGVGYDGSPEARAAARLACDLAGDAGARLRVISVLEPPDAGAIRDQAQERLDDLVAGLGEIATGDIVIGDRITQLGNAARDLDLLVVGSRGYGPVRRVTLGSTSSKLVRRAPCPVLVLTRTAVEQQDLQPVA